LKEKRGIFNFDLIYSLLVNIQSNEWWTLWVGRSVGRSVHPATEDTDGYTHLGLSVSRGLMSILFC